MNIIALFAVLFTLAPGFNLPGHLPASNYAVEQTITMPITEWYADDQHLPATITFREGESSYLIMKFLFEGTMSIDVDHPKTLTMEFVASNIILNPKLSIYVFPTNYIDTHCAQYTEQCLRQLIARSRVRSQGYIQSGKAIFDLTEIARYSEHFNVQNTEAIITVTNGDANSVTLNVASAVITAIVEARPVGVQWPPNEYCLNYFITLPTQLVPNGPVMSEPINISVFDCPGPRRSKKVIDLLVPVPGSCYHYRNMIHNNNEPVQLTDYARVICWDPVGHGLTTAPESWDEFNMTIPFQTAVMDAVYAQVLKPREIVMGVTHDRQSVVFQDWCWRPENKNRCAGAHLDEAWLFTICGPEFEELGICSSKYLFAQTLYPGGPPLFDIGSYDGSPVTVYCNNGSEFKLIAGFNDCLFDHEHCGYNLSVKHRMFLNEQLYSAPYGPDSEVPTLNEYYNPNTGIHQPADWISPMIPWSFFPIFAPVLSYDPVTCQLLPSMGFGIRAMTSSTVYGYEEIYQYELGWNIAVHGDEARKRLVRLGQQPLSIPMKKKWIEEKSGLGYVGATNIEILQDIIERMKAPDGPMVYVLVPDMQGNAAVPLPDVAYFLENYPTGRVRETSGNFQHWMADAAPGAKVQSVLWAAKEMERAGLW
jgi:pimeloyl-ACP methyl ester carboxylesterase